MHYHWGCKSIKRLLSYPFRSLICGTWILNIKFLFNTTTYKSCFPCLSSIKLVWQDWVLGKVGAFSPTISVWTLLTSGKQVWTPLDSTSVIWRDRLTPRASPFRVMVGRTLSARDDWGRWWETSSRILSPANNNSSLNNN